MRKILLLSAICCSLAFTADDQPTLAKSVTDNFIRQVSNANDGGETGEQVAWNWNYTLSSLMQACKNWPTDTWLAPTEKALNMMADKMATGPDGYKGFIGPYIYDNNFWADCHVGDAILVKHLLAFAEIIHDNPDLKEKYGESAKRFVDIAKRDLIEKWEKRGTFFVDGPFAGYTEWNMFCNPGELDKWTANNNVRGEGATTPSIPFNKDMDMAVCMLQIHRITGEQIYRDNAQKIYDRFKASINRFDGAATWNYWEPTWPGDIVNLKNPNHKILAHWVDTHPFRPYQAGELHNVVYAYNMGVTFTDEDIKRFITTNLRFMWNGDKENPIWNNSNSTLPGIGQPEDGFSKAGTVWTALAPFDSTIREISLNVLNESDIIPRTALEKLPSPAFERKFRPEAKVEDFAWMKDIKESKGQSFALVITSVVEPEKTTVIFSKSHAPRSEANIYARPLAGGERKLIKTIPNFGGSEQFAYEWDCMIDGKRTPGEYVIIWDYMDGERAFPVTLK